MITKEASNPQNCIYNHLFFDSARFAFGFLLDQIAVAKDFKILMPAYIGQSQKEGSGVFDPIRKRKVVYEFYTLEKDLSINFEALKDKCLHTKINALFIIHYFGFIQPEIQNIANFCKQNNIILIEDCAHSMGSVLNGHPIGSFGDYALFSIHKIIPTPHGGILQINNNTLFPDSLQNINIQDLLQYARTKLDDIYRIRVRNYNQYLSELETDNKIEILFSDVKENVPLNFPILIKQQDRFSLYNKFLAAGMPVVSLWYQLIDEIPVQNFPISFNISKQILNLPVHQDISPEDIFNITNFIKEIED